MKVGFYTCSGTATGYGNLSRCVILARGFREQGDTVAFFNRGPWPAFIAGDFTRCDDLAALLKDCGLLVVDGLRIDQQLAAQAKRAACVVVQVDDNGADCEWADVIVNPNFYGDRVAYPKGKPVFGGVKYNLIAPEFFARQTAVKRRGVVVGFGGSDNGQWGVPTALGLAGKGLAVTLLIARDRSELDQQQLASLQAAGVTVLCNSAALEALKGCELYVGAAGVTSGEALAAGCKLAVCSIVDNQRDHVQVLQSAGYAATQGFDLDTLLQLAERAMCRAAQPEALLAGSGVAALVEALHEYCQTVENRGRDHAHTGL